MAALSGEDTFTGKNEDIPEECSANLKKIRN
jgi:hypothetical protein